MLDRFRRGDAWMISEDALDQAPVGRAELVQ